MTTWLYTFLRFLINIALQRYFKRILVDGLENIPANHPLILVANHQNALIDPLLIGTQLTIRPHYLTRAAAFKNRLAAYALNKIQLLPVYRMRDGFSTLNQNQNTFEKTYQILNEKGAILIFAEGNHSLVRNIRPLSKGFTRIAYGALAKYPELSPRILPIGIQYSAHKKSGGLARISIGKSIAVTPDPSQAQVLVKQVEQALKSLVVDIPDANYTETLNQLIANQVDCSNKQEVELFLSGKPISYQVNSYGSFRNKLMKICHLPLYWIWLFIIAPKVEDEVFTGTWKFLVGFIGAPIYYMVVVYFCFHPEYGSWFLSFLLVALSSLWINQNSQE